MLKLTYLMQLEYLYILACYLFMMSMNAALLLSLCFRLSLPSSLKGNKVSMN